jgi:hypothetical protein
LPCESGTPGTTVCFDLKAKHTIGSRDLMNEEFTTDITFDASYFLPSPPYQGYINGNQRIINIKEYPKLLTEDEYLLAEICGTVMLVEGDSTDFYINNFKWRDSTILIDYENGCLRVLPVCGKNLRSIKESTPTSMSIAPNPVTGNNGNQYVNIKIISEENGLFSINVFSINGMKIYSDKWYNINPENVILEKKIEFNTSEFNSGVYFISLKTPYFFLVKPVIIE